MDNKKTIIGMGVVFLLCMGYWFILVHYVYPKHPNWTFGPDQQNQAQKNPSSTTQSTTTASSSGSTTVPSIGPAPAGLSVASTQPASSPVVMGSIEPGDPTYALGLHIDPQGAAIQSVTINSYKNADKSGLYIFQKPLTEASYSALATKSVSIDGQNIDLSGSNWALESSGKSLSAETFGLDISGVDHKPLLHIDKSFQLQERGPSKNRDNTTAGYTVVVQYHFKNLSNHPLKTIQLQFNGPTMPDRDLERSDDRTIVGGFEKSNSYVEMTRDYLSEFKPGPAADKDITSYNNEKFLWAGTSSNYFGAVIQPDKGSLIDKVMVHCPNPEAVSSEDRMITMSFQTAAISLAPGETADVPLNVFFGPKERDLLEGDYYGVFPRCFNQMLASTGGCYSYCLLTSLVDWLTDLLQFFHFILRDWGLAIIALVVLVRAILHPILKRSQVSMLKLQKMGPEMERLKKKYGDDKEGLSKAQMEMQKEMGIAPFLGCLPMFLQMPIWIALYSALQNDISLRQAPFLWGWTWITDLARPDRLLHWDVHPMTIPIIGMKLVSLNILPLCVAVVMFLQQKLQPQPPTMTPEQESQQKMMRYMSLAFSLFFYWMPSGLNLYILTSSTIAIFESKIIRKHIKEKEEAEKSGKVIVDAKVTRQGKQKKKDDTQSKTSNAGCLGGVWGNLQNKVEELQREAERKKRQKGDD